MESNDMSENVTGKDKTLKTTLFKDVLTEDDRELLENNGQDLEMLPLHILLPAEEELRKDFNGD